MAAIEYMRYDIESTDEIIMALLSQFSFESFEEKETTMVAYIPATALEYEKNDIASLLQERNVDFAVSKVENINWNAQWEASFQPIVVDRFCCVRAEFHDADPSVLHDIIINPKMAFGTGHHETTYMMMQQMQDIDFMDKRVFDFGCGTGILSVLADKLGASHIDAIDIEEESYLNTVENAKLNHSKNIAAAQETLDTFVGTGYDIILANINRNVLLESSKTLYQASMPQGIVLLSGILLSDEELLLKRYKIEGFIIDTIRRRGEWVCIQLSKT